MADENNVDVRFIGEQLQRVLHELGDFYEKVKEGKLSANAAAIEAKKRAERERSSKTDNITLEARPSSRGAQHLKPSQGPRAFQFWPAANQ